MKCTIHWESSVSSTMMKPMSRLLCVAMLIIAMNALMCVLAEEELYPDYYDDLDVQTVLNNQTLRNSYYNCFMKIAKCQTERHVIITEIFGKAYITNCKKCTEKQKEMVKMVSEWYMKNEPDEWKLINARLEDIKKEANQSTANSSAANNKDGSLNTCYIRI